MTPSKPIRTYTLQMADGQQRHVDATSLEELTIREFGDEATLKKEVAAVRWKQKSTLCTYVPETGETHAEIADADVNPFGWRQKHR